ncbi:phosphoglycerate mutase-like protein [Sanghuangporus baumii]|uniref:Phosphoglycerate mutase-like protein n=1 Tax=Sanghuangporus baumii TaxID=108892 RepID=A0A9Q5I079_SANBA|nr:phosphoglycerate mutase-like protein [Sanghuangporus baumii]
MTSSSGPSSYGLYPPQEALDVAGYPIPPSDLALEQVHVYIRHGERTPVRVRMSDPPASIPARWALCRTARQAHAPVATFGEAVRDSPRASDGIDFLPIKRIVESADGSVIDGECLLGDLTDLGRRSTHNFGRALRKLYVEKLGFLPDTLSDVSEGYFRWVDFPTSVPSGAKHPVRSTNMPRTIESLHQVIHGLYPRSKLAHGLVPQIRVRNGIEDDIIPNSYSCPRLEQLLINFAKAAAAAYNHTLEPLDEKLSKYIGGRPVRVDGQPRASGIMDTIRASKAHGIKVPPEFQDERIVGLIEKAVVTEWFADKTEEPRRLGMGRLLDDLSRKMSLKVSQASASQTASATKGSITQIPPPKILVYSTHDTALAALLSTLDVFDEQYVNPAPLTDRQSELGGLIGHRWPPFTSSVTFELFKKTRDAEDNQASYLQTVLSTLSPFKKLPKPSQHCTFKRPPLSLWITFLTPLFTNSVDKVVRVRYKNQNLSLPFCSSQGKHMEGHPEFCTLAAFQERIRELVPADWETACAARPTSS